MRVAVLGLRFGRVRVGAVWGAQLALRVVVLHVVVQQRCLAEGLGAAWHLALKRVVVQFDGEDGRRLVLDNPVHCGGDASRKLLD